MGSSSAVSVIAAVNTAVRLKKQWQAQSKSGRSTVVTILCDSATRHLPRIHIEDVLNGDFGIDVPGMRLHHQETLLELRRSTLILALCHSRDLCPGWC